MSGNMLQLTDKGLPKESFDLINDEDKAQITKWDHQRHDVFEWLAYTVEELGELSRAISEYIYRDGDIESIVDEAVHTATLALKIAWMCNKHRERGIDNERL